MCRTLNKVLEDNVLIPRSRINKTNTGIKLHLKPKFGQLCIQVLSQAPKTQCLSKLDDSEYSLSSAQSAEVAAPDSSAQPVFSKVKSQSSSLRIFSKLFLHI